LVKGLAPIVRPAQFHSGSLAADYKYYTDTPAADVVSAGVDNERGENLVALRGASETTQDQDWLDLKELAKEGAAAVFTPVRLCEEEDYGNGPFTPVIADVIVLTGKNAGAYFPGEKIMAAGVRVKIQEMGDSVVGRVRPYGSRKHPGLEPEEDGDLALAERALKKYAPKSGTKKAAAAESSDEEPPF
jgi:hypothetical protein